MRITPLIVWARELSDEDFEKAIRLQSYLTHSDDMLHEATFIYSYAIRKIIKDPSVKPVQLYEDMRNLCYQRLREGKSKGNITDWFDEIDKGHLPYAT
jgi:ADP-ribosylglycohydrolase